MISLTDRVALVTAGSRGLGAEVVRQLAGQGADVAFTYLQDSSAADSLVAEIEGSGRKALAIRADASDFVKAKETVNTVIRNLGRLDILVCNAGIARSAPIWNMSEEDWDRVLEVSL